MTHRHNHHDYNYHQMRSGIALNVYKPGARGETALS